MDKKIIIVGYGIVGTAEYDRLFEKYHPDVLDLKFAMIDHVQMSFELGLEEIKHIKYDLAIIAVPTPLDQKSGILDCHYVEEAIQEVNANIYLVKSTTKVGYCDYLATQTGKRIVHSPEHSGITQHSNNFSYDFTILGGDTEDCQVVQEIYQEIFDARHIFRYLTRSESEASKFVVNCYLPNNVSFWDSIWESCNKLGICFENVREAALLDQRIPRPHSAVYPSHPYCDSPCFNKDEISFANQADNEYLKTSYNYNEKMKKKYKKD